MTSSVAKLRGVARRSRRLRTSAGTLVPGHECWSLRVSETFVPVGEAALIYMYGRRPMMSPNQRTTMNRLFSAALGGLLLTAASAQAQDSSFSAMQQRGKIAMGVDQYTSIHKFDDLVNGGRIELQRD